MTSLPALREAVAKMTEGPWEVGGPFPGTTVVRCIDRGIGDAEPPCFEKLADLNRILSGPPDVRAEADAAGIVALRNAAPALLDEVEALQAEVRKQVFGSKVVFDREVVERAQRAGEEHE